MQLLLYFAAFLLLVVSAAHSYLGERYLLVRLFRRDDLPRVFGTSESFKLTLRFGWHVASVAWMGLAAVLVALAHPPVDARVIGVVVGITFLIHFLIALIASKGKHLSWIAFLAVGLFAIVATMGSAHAAEPVDRERALEIAEAYFSAHVGCGGLDDVTDGGDRWVIHARVGYAGSPVNGFYIDKKTGVLTVPPARGSTVSDQSVLPAVHALHRSAIRQNRSPQMERCRGPNRRGSADLHERYQMAMPDRID
jgi:hypothetical protein